MRILCVGASKNDKVLGISATLKKMGHDVETVYSDPYSGICPYWEKKLYRLGVRTIYHRYMNAWKKDFQEKLVKLTPDFILFVDFWDEFFSMEEMAILQQRCPLILWLVDSVARFEHTLDPYFTFFSKIWCFEGQDVTLLQRNYQADAEYLPIGYNEVYQNISSENEDKLYDLGFVGVPHHKRLHLLEYILAQTKATAKICGPFYSTNYFWKKGQFKRRYPYIFRYLDNRFYEPVEVAQVYAQSRICLNINQKNHQGINPRTYDIMATGAFELLEERQEYGPILKPGQNIVIFHDPDDLVGKIKYYLAHEKERKMMAQIGYQAVYGRVGIRNCLQKIINSVEETDGRKNFSDD